MSAQYRFVVQEGPNNTLCIELTHQGGEHLPIFNNGTIGLDLRPGATKDEAQQIARVLNRMVAGVTYVEG